MPDPKKQRKRTRARRGEPFKVPPDLSAFPQGDGKRDGPMWLWHNYPWHTADVVERQRFAAMLLYATLVYGDARGAVTLCMEQIVSMYLRGAVHPATLAREAAGLAANMGGDWRKRTDIESASYLALSAVYQMLLDTHRGRPVPKLAIKRFRESAQRIAKIGAFKGRQKLAHAELIECARNLCDGTGDGLRLFVQFVMMRVHGNMMGAVAFREADRIAEALQDRGVEHDGEDLSRTSLASASEEARKRLLHVVLRELGVTPPRSGSRRE